METFNMNTGRSFVLLCLLCCVRRFSAKLNSISCYNEYIEDGIEEISIDKPPPRSIFFHDTFCRTGPNYTLIINPRHACAVESAARQNPNSLVYLLYNSPIRYPDDSSSSTRNYNLIRELLLYNNVRIRRVNFLNYTRGTPLEEWYKRGDLNTSIHPVGHASEVLRYLTLWKYGGTFMDFDVVVLKNIYSLGKNFAGVEGNNTIQNAVFNIENENFGHKLADECLRQIRENFHQNELNHNGAKLLNRSLTAICPTGCKEFNMLDSKVFYPIPRRDTKLYFDPRMVEQVMSQVNGSFVARVWRGISQRKAIYTKSAPVGYGLIAEQFCPNIYKTSGFNFQ